MSAPRPAPGLATAPFGDGLLVSDAATDRLHVLNGSMRLVLEACDGRRDVDAVVGAVADAVGLDPGTVAGDVRAGVDDLRRVGLLDPAPTPARPDAGARETATFIPTANPSARLLRALGLDAAVVVAPGADVAAGVDRRLGLDDGLALLDGLRVEDGPDDRMTWHVTVEDPDVLSVTVNGTVVSRGAPEDAWRHLLWHLNHLAVTGHRSGLLVHAGVVAGPAGAVVLPGAPEAGKSTLTAALVAGGAEYLTDEAAAVGSDLTVEAYPKPVALDPDAVARLARLGHPVPSWAGHVDPRALGRVAPTATRRPLHAVVLPDRTRDGAPTRLTPDEAATRIGAASFTLAPRGAEALATLARVALDVPVWSLPTADLSSARDWLLRLLAEPPTGVT